MPPPTATQGKHFAPSNDEAMEVEEQTSQGTEAEIMTHIKGSEMLTDIGVGLGKNSAEADQDMHEAVDKVLADDTKVAQKVHKKEMQPENSMGEKLSDLHEQVPESGTEQEQPKPQTEPTSMETEGTTGQVDNDSVQPTADDGEHQKMPDHPGRDSDSEYSDNED